MADQQLPANAVQRRILPSIAGFKVSKWDRKPGGYRAKDDVFDESGKRAKVIGIDSCETVDAELVVLTGTPFPKELDVLSIDTSAVLNYTGPSVFFVDGIPSELGTVGGARKSA